MKKSIILLTLLTAILTLTVSTNIFAQTRGSERDSHPRIAAAINTLQEAKAELQAASHNYGGHRAEAVRACDNAIKQLNYALSYRAREDHHRGALTDPSLSDSLRAVSYQNREIEREEHPRIAAAIGALKEARIELSEAPHDFGGHKAGALAAVDNAIRQLQSALDYRAQQDRRR